jgi:hypothetical protein
MEDCGQRNSRMERKGPIPNWLPDGKRAAVCFSIDDVHPAKSSDAYEAGGDLGKGALRHVQWLLDRHPQLEVTLFVAADWREIAPVSTRKLLALIPGVAERAYLTPVLPQGTMRLDRHPDFVRFLKGMPRTDIGFHGLYHVHRGQKIVIEFQDEPVVQMKWKLERAKEIFKDAGIDSVAGMCPPGWDAPLNLQTAMADVGMTFLCSARDVRTPVSGEAMTNMSGMKGVSLIYPQKITGGLIQMTSNFAPNNPIDRAFEIIESGGLLAFKGHIVKKWKHYFAIDGVDEHYVNYWDVIMTTLENKYGDALWWTSFDEIARRCRAGSDSTKDHRAAGPPTNTS